jgi:hypothetical protein
MRKRSRGVFEFNWAPVIIFLLILPVGIFECEGQSGEDGLLYKLMSERQADFEQVLKNPDRFRVQILYTQIDRDQNNTPHFRSHAYRVNAEEYFYPASSIKIFGAALALEKLNRLNIEQLDRSTWVRIDSSYAGQQKVTTDTSSASGKPSMGHFIKKLLVLSDNDAYNRTYEFLGQEGLNERLRSKGYDKIRLTHRLSVPLGTEENRHTNAMEFYRKDDGRILYRQEALYSKTDFTSKNPILLGDSYVAGSKTIRGPMDFSAKNYCSVRELQKGLKSLIFPLSVPENERFDLRPADYAFIRTYMSQLPRETIHPDYREYPDNYCKFFIYGDDDKARIPDNLRLFNKIGLAYGFCIDNAYVVDLDKNIEFMLTAVIYANENETLNDGLYQYETIAFPFMARLGRMIYEYELNRPREVRPDLDQFRLEYDLSDTGKGQ